MWFIPNKVRAITQPFTYEPKYVSPKTDNDAEEWGQRRMALIKSMQRTMKGVGNNDKGN